jgi:DNA-binding MarR family transcriptional regulator/ribosomal protein S18 acetylase RimI-like enzyme
MTDFLASLGTIAFSYRTRRLADRMADAGRRLYAHLELPLEPNWHALLLYLDRHGTVSVTEAAGAIKVSHPAVIEMARRMEDAGLIVTRADDADRRRRVLALSPEGARRLPEFQALWAEIGAELDDLIEATGGSDALGSLATLEAQLDGAELDERVLRRHQAAGAAAAPGCEARPRQTAQIRAASEPDRDAVVHIARGLVRDADTYAYDPDISDRELWRYWLPDVGDGFVAEVADAIVGMFVIRPNNPGPGDHVANASFAVRADVRGLGLGRQMGQAALREAAALGYRAMQFNTVVSTNTGAIRLWRSLGFRIVGTIPAGFRLPDGRLVAHHVMYRTLP